MFNTDGLEVNYVQKPASLKNFRLFSISSPILSKFTSRKGDFKGNLAQGIKSTYAKRTTLLSQDKTVLNTCLNKSLDDCPEDYTRIW